MQFYFNKKKKKSELFSSRYLCMVQMLCCLSCMVFNLYELFIRLQITHSIFDFTLIAKEIHILKPFTVVQLIIFNFNFSRLIKTTISLIETLRMILLNTVVEKVPKIYKSIFTLDVMVAYIYNNYIIDRWKFQTPFFFLFRWNVKANQYKLWYRIWYYNVSPFHFVNLFFRLLSSFDIIYIV